MARLRLFGPAREIAGEGDVEVPAANVAEVIAWATTRYGRDFEKLLERSRVWVNGETSPMTRSLESSDEVAIIPPVSGG